MTDLSPREILRDLLQPVLPKDWKYITSERSADTLSATTVFIKQRSIKPLPEAPNGAHSIGFVVQVATPLTDLDKAEDRLDDEVNALIHAIDDSPNIQWQSADKTLVTDQNLGYDLSLTLISQKD